MDLATWPWYYRVRRWRPDRTGQACQLVAQGKRNRLIRFADGELVVVPFFAIRRRRREP